MRKLTQEEINEIRELYSQGKTQVEIAKIIGISQKAVSYWVVDEDKRSQIRKKAYSYFKKKSLEERRKVYRKRLPYLRNYIKNKYHTNEDFRKKKIEYISEYQKKKKSRH